MGEQDGIFCEGRHAPCHLPVDLTLLLPISAEDVGVEELLSDAEGNEGREHKDSYAMFFDEHFQQAKHKKDRAKHDGDHETVIRRLQS